MVLAISGFALIATIVRTVLEARDRRDQLQLEYLKWLLDQQDHGRSDSRSMIAAHGSNLTLDFGGDGRIDYRYPSHGGEIDHCTGLGVALHYHIHQRALAPLTLRNGRPEKNAKGYPVFQCQGHERWARTRWAVDPDNANRIVAFLKELVDLAPDGPEKRRVAKFKLNVPRVMEMFKALVLFDNLHS